MRLDTTQDHRIRKTIYSICGFSVRLSSTNQVKADSESLMVCRSALAVVTQPPELWYKDEGGKNNCIEICVQVKKEPSPLRFVVRFVVRFGVRFVGAWPRGPPRQGGTPDPVGFKT